MRPYTVADPKESDTTTNCSNLHSDTNSFGTSKNVSSQNFSTLRGLVCSLLSSLRGHISTLSCSVSFPCTIPLFTFSRLRPCTSDFSSHIQDLQRSHLSVMIYLVSCFDRTTSSASSVVQAPCLNKLAICNLHQPFCCFTKWEPHRTCNSVADYFGIDSLCDLHCQHHQHLCMIRSSITA